MVRHLLDRARREPIDLARVSCQLGTGAGRLRAPADALDQPDSEPSFELPNLQADRRLRQRQPLGGSGKAAELDHVEKGSQVVEIERLHG